MNANESVAPPRGRIVSVDAIRGFDMFWIGGGQQTVLALVGLFVLPIPVVVQRNMRTEPKGARTPHKSRR